MTKILVTVGSTKFDPLIIALDKPSNIDGLEVFFQISNGEYFPKNHDYIKFSSEFNSLVSEFDYVICHAGAGTVYSLLERSVRIMVIPNVVRHDKHQLELADYVRHNKYGISMSVDEFFDLSWYEILLYFEGFLFEPYLKEGFFKGEEILDFFKQKN